MDIYEDDITLSEDDEVVITDKGTMIPLEEKKETKKEIPVPVAEPKRPERPKSDSPGTRIIYQAPENSRKRKFTGFRDEDEIIEELKEEPVRHEYKGGYAFEEELRQKNTSPVRRPQQPVRKAQPQSTLSFEEEKKRRYVESVKRAELEKAEAARRKAAYAQKKKEQILFDSEVEEINIDDIPEEKTTADKIRMAVIIVASIALVVASAVLVKQLVQSKIGSRWEEEVTGLLIEDTEPTTKKHKKDKNKEEPTTERILTIEEQWAQLYNDYPNVTFPQGLSLKYAKLYAVNQDFVGYISIDQYGVGLPVVQSQKDKDGQYFYLRRNFYKQNNVFGCPFVLKDNDMQNLDRNTVIYGHNNNSNLAFAPLKKYKTIDGFRAAPVIRFDTVNEPHTWKIIAVMITNALARDDDGYFFNYTFRKMTDDQEFMNYIGELRQRSLYDTGVDVMPGDKILTLSTCSYEFDDARLVVVARLVRPGETDDVNTSIARVNEKPRYPQAFYDKKKKKNPYKDAAKWYYSGDLG